MPPVSIQNQENGYALQFQEQPSQQTLQYKQLHLLANDPSAQALEALENFRAKLPREASSQRLLENFAAQFQSMKSLQADNTDRQESNLSNLKNQVFEPNNQILNRPIGEDYAHRKMRGVTKAGGFQLSQNAYEDVESTIKLSFVLEEMRKDPKQLKKILGSHRKSDAGVFKYKLRHGPTSPLAHKDSNLKLFDTLTRDVKVVQTAKKELLMRQ